jgi:hypothetical protein
MITHWAILKHSTDAAVESACEDLIGKLTAASPYVDEQGNKFPWAEPKPSTTSHWAAVPLEDWGMPVVPVDPNILVVTDEVFKADATWFPRAPIDQPEAAPPWWGFLVWWK